MSINERLKELATVDIFKDVSRADAFIGRPFYFDFNTMKVLSNDHWKEKVAGVPAGAFLTAFLDNDADHPEVVLLRVLGPTALPTDSDVVAAMVDHYKESEGAEAPTGHLDSYTRYEFQFSGLECRVLGSFYRDPDGKTRFGADVDNFYGPNNYSVYKPSGRVLEFVVNFREGTGVPGGPGDQPIGEVRYASSRRHRQADPVPVYVSAFDYLGKRTALFGMTRTGKSNTVKMIIKATAELAPSGAKLDGEEVEPIGQIIFDVNGEYANDNQQDEGTAIYQLYSDVTRYSIKDKPGFRVMKVNFYRDIEAGFSMVRGGLGNETSGYIRAFVNIDWEEPSRDDRSAHTRWERRVACYKCILRKAGFAPPTEIIRFPGAKDINKEVNINPKSGVSYEDAIAWFEWAWENYNQHEFFNDYRRKNNREWADDDLQSLLQFLTRTSGPGGRGRGTQLGFRKLIPLRDNHTSSVDRAYELEIIDLLRAGKIVIIDLSQGNPVIQRTHSDRLCRAIFDNAMQRFIDNKPASFVQMYFEEAHNLFPKQHETDLTLVYNRIAKEGAKLGLGLIYATQEVSSISSNVLKNTQNWFVSHLNNRDELREVAKYYDFEDFIDSLRRTTDKGFIRMKTYSNAFIVPVQIDRFTATGA